MTDVDDALAKRLGKDRARLLGRLTAGAWPGTDYLVAQLLEASKGRDGYRAERSAALIAAADLDPDGRIWMLPEEFAAFVKESRQLARLRGDPPNVARDVLNISPGRIRDMQRADRSELRGARPSKVEALACAHYTLGLTPAIEAGNAGALRGWFSPRFLSVTSVPSALNVSAPWLRERMDGTRPPEGSLIRALDWLYRLGPWCPYGDRPAVDLWPDHKPPAR